MSSRTTPPFNGNAPRADAGRTDLEDLPKREGDDAIATTSTAIAPIQREIDCLPESSNPAVPVEREYPALPGGPEKPGLARGKN